MERKLKKIPAYFRVNSKWFKCAAEAGMKSSQVGAALEYALACYLREPFELPKDPAARVLAAVMKSDIEEIYKLVENGEFPFLYIDKDGEPVGEIQNCTPEEAKEFEENVNYVESMIQAIISAGDDSSK